MKNLSTTNVLEPTHTPKLRYGLGDLQFFNGDPGTGDPGTGDPGAGTGTGTGDPGQGAGAGNPNPPQPFAVFPDEASFMARVKREGKAQLNETLKTLGFEKLEDLQTVIAAHNKKIEDEKTDLQKAQDAAAAAAKAQADAIARANQVVLTTEAKVQAMAAGIPAEKLDMALRLMDLSGVDVKDGVVDGSLVKEAVEKVLQALPELKGTPGTGKAGGDFGGGNKPTGLTMEAIKNMSQQEMESRLDEVTAFLASQK